MKKFVIVLARTFPKGHSRYGDTTNFRCSFIRGIGCKSCSYHGSCLRTDSYCNNVCEVGRCESSKIHTIRGNYELWERRFKEIEEGKACLSIREWSGTPYRSNQIEIGLLTSSDNVGIQKLLLRKSEWIDEDNEKHYCYWAEVDGKEVNLDELAKNDGFSDVGDYVTWFYPDIERQSPDKDGFKHLELVIIHFTGFRYE